MSRYRLITEGLWVLFAVYWALAAMRTKRSAGWGQRWRGGMGLRLALVVLIFVLLQFRQLRQLLAGTQRFVGHSVTLGTLGVVLCLLGFALAFCARFYIGRNWGPPMSQKVDPELVTRGPYALIRHPIYAGIILAMLGSALAMSLVWAPLLVLFGAYFIYSARREESRMLQLFPEQYPAYRARTGMLTPRLFRGG